MIIASPQVVESPPCFSPSARPATVVSSRARRAVVAESVVEARFAALLKELSADARGALLFLSCYRFLLPFSASLCLFAC